MNNSQRSVYKELGFLWFFTLLAIRIVVMAHDAGLHEIVLAAVPFLFVYVPVYLCDYRKVDSYDYHLALPAFSDRAAWKDAAFAAAKVIAIILIPWLVGYHYYQTLIFHLHPAFRTPKDAWLLVPYHLFFVAVPEEFFYRGYIQTRLNEILPYRWKVFGVEVGWSLPLTAIIFAFGHSVVTVRWWHFAIFFPALVFGWLREKTKGTLAGAFFHAWCNITVAWLDAIYGVRL